MSPAPRMEGGRESRPAIGATDLLAPRFYLDGRPLTVVYEVFSPALDRYLGASDAAGPASPAANGRGPGVGSGGS